MIRKARCMFTLMWFMVRYKCSKTRNDFWSWLCTVTLEQKGNERKRCMIWFLLADALDREDDGNLRVLFEQHRDYMNTLTFSLERIFEVEEIFMRTGNDHLIGIMRAKDS